MPAKDLHKTLGPLAPLFEDPDILEIMVDGPERVTFERKGKIEAAGIRFKSADEVTQIVRAILESTGITFEEDKAIYEVRLTDNSRMVAVLSPTAIDGPSIIFRKWMTHQLTWEKLTEYKAVSPGIRDLFQGALHAHAGILIAGGTSSGKTTVANRVIELIPPEERIIAVEQSHQLQFTHPRAVFMESSAAMHASFTDLLNAASRMRPDWLVVGELEGPEAMRALQLFGNGYSGITTMHAASAENALIRLEAMCLMANLGLGLDDIRGIIAAGLRLIAYQERLSNGSRKVTQVVEICGVEDGRYVLKPLMRYIPETDRFESSGIQPGWVK